MKITSHLVMHNLVNVSLMIPVVAAAYIIGLALQRLTYPTEIFDIKLVTEQPVAPGQVVDVAFKVIRRKSCLLGITRVIERTSDRREFIMGSVNQIIEADDPPKPRFSGYRTQIPPELTTDSYLLYSRYRYYCSGLDEWSPWVRRTPAIPVQVLSHD